MITGKRTYFFFRIRSMLYFLHVCLLSFFKISLLMAKCQKSENFLSELQQAFLQAKRSVQEQMVSQVNSRDPWPALFVWAWELSVSVKGFVCPARAGWRGLSIFTCKGLGPVGSGGKCWGWNSLCHPVSVFLHTQEQGDHWPASFPLIHCPIPCPFAFSTSPQIWRQ